MSITTEGEHGVAQPFLCSGETTITCTVSQIFNGYPATITIVVRPTVAGTLTNTATVSAEKLPPEPPSIDSNLANNTSTATTTGIGSEASDADSDGVPDSSDNCPNAANSDQADTDGDGVGDVCDQKPKNKNKSVKGGQARLSSAQHKNLDTTVARDSYRSGAGAGVRSRRNGTNGGRLIESLQNRQTAGPMQG